MPATTTATAAIRSGVTSANPSAAEHTQGAHREDAREEPRALDAEQPDGRVPAHEPAGCHGGAEVDERGELAPARRGHLDPARHDAPGGEHRQRQQARVGRHREGPEPLQVGRGEQREGGLAGEGAEREAEAEPRDPAIGPLHARGAEGDHDAGEQHASADRTPLEQRRRDREHDRDAAHDHADRRGIRLANALDHEEVEENEPGGRERGHPEQLAPREPRQPPTRDRQQDRRRDQVAKELALGERIALDGIGRRHERADQRERR